MAKSNQATTGKLCPPLFALENIFQPAESEIEDFISPKFNYNETPSLLQKVCHPSNILITEDQATEVRKPEVIDSKTSTLYKVTDNPFAKKEASQFFGLLLNVPSMSQTKPPQRSRLDSGSISSSSSDMSKKSSLIKQRLKRMKSTKKITHGIKKIEHTNQKLRALAWDEFNKQQIFPRRQTFSNNFIMFNALSLLNGSDKMSRKQKSFV